MCWKCESSRERRNLCKKSFCRSFHVRFHGRQTDFLNKNALSCAKNRCIGRVCTSDATDKTTFCTDLPSCEIILKNAQARMWNHGGRGRRFARRRVPDATLARIRSGGRAVCHGEERGQSLRRGEAPAQGGRFSGGATECAKHSRIPGMEHIIEQILEMLRAGRRAARAA